MLKIELDLSAFDKALDQQIVRLTEELPQRIPEELLLWQSEDMNRKNRRVYEEGGDSWYTLIYPRSRLSGRGIVRKKTRGRRIIKPLPRATGSKRPILREELLFKLVDRVTQMLQYTAVWK